MVRADYLALRATQRPLNLERGRNVPIPCRVSSLATVYIKSDITDKVSGLSVDITGDAVQIAFTTPGTDPVTNDWNAAIWQTDSTTTPPTYTACCLVGPTGVVTLAKGRYEMWVKVTDSPEVPVLTAGAIEVY